MAKNRKGKVRKTKPLNYKHEAMFNALFNYADQILEHKRDDADYIIDPIIDEICLKVDSHFKRIANRMYITYGLALTLKVETYLNNEVLSIIKQDLAGPRKLRPEMLLLLTFDYLFNTIKHKECSVTFSSFRHLIQSTITRLNNVIVNAKVISYNYDALEIMVGNSKGPLVYKDVKLGEKTRNDLKYKASILFTMVADWVDELKDPATITAINESKDMIVKVTEIFNEGTIIDKSTLVKYIEDEIMSIEIDGVKPMTGLVITYGILGYLSSVKPSNIFKTHFGNLDLTNLGNIDLDNKVVANNVMVVVDMLDECVIEYD